MGLSAHDVQFDDDIRGCWDYSQQRAQVVAPGYPMTPADAYDPLGAESPDDLKGLGILLVEDSWHIGRAMKSLLQVMGADVIGPAATAAEAERLVAERAPDVAIVDYSLRGGEPANGLIDRLQDQGIGVIVISGYPVLPQPLTRAAPLLQKPISEAQLLASLRPFVAQKAASRRASRL